MNTSGTYLWIPITLLMGFFGLLAISNISEIGEAMKARIGLRRIVGAQPPPSVGESVFAPGVGDIRLTSFVGKGRFSWVMQGESKGEIFALKFRNTEAGRSQILREVEVLSALDSSEGFPRVHSTDSDGKFFVMDFLTGYVSLDRVSEVDQLPLSVGDLMSQLITRLEQVHKAGFVYGDIHRRNIYVAEAGPVMVGDFALSSKTTTDEPPKIVNLYLGSVAEQERLPLRPIDDIERLAFVLIDFLYKDRLPWIDTYKYRAGLKNPKGNDKTSAAISDSMILKAKKKFSDNETFFTHNDVHVGFKLLLKYVRTYRLSGDRQMAIDYSVIHDFFLGQNDI